MLLKVFLDTLGGGNTGNHIILVLLGFRKKCFCVSRTDSRLGGAICIPAAPQYRHDDGPVYAGAGSQYHATGTAPSHTPPSSQLSSPLPPQEQLTISVIFTPTKEKVYCSALDISDVAHSRKYRVGTTDVLCGRRPASL